MIYEQTVLKDALLSETEILSTLTNGLEKRFTGQKVLVLIPDHTRSLPLPQLFPMVVNLLSDARQLDFMVALGTHPPLSEEHLLKLTGLTAKERGARYSQIGLNNHTWSDPATLTSIGVIEQDEIKALAGDVWHPSLPVRVDIRINKAALEYDHILILGPVYPHEVVGFSGGAKYLFPGISGPDMINATHWLGALSGVVGTIGLKDTPVRAMVHAAASHVKTPVTLAALIVQGHDLSGLLVGELYTTWNAAADVSSQQHIRWYNKPFQRVLACAPAMYDELWTAGKAMYKTEPVVAVGGEVVIYAPHLETVSHTHGRYIYEVGYHILPYFLNEWERFKHVPLGALAHSTHVRGAGVMENGIEKPNVRVVLSSKISAEDCARLGLGYLDPAKIDLEDWKEREDEGVLYIPIAGEILYRLKKDI